MSIHDVIRQQIRIAGVELAIAAELAPRCDRQRAISFTRPLLGNRRVCLIARQQEHRRGPLCPTGRAAIPGGDAHVFEAGVEHLEHFDFFRGPERVRNDLRVQGNRCSLVQHTVPERIKVSWFFHSGLVVDWHRLRHDVSSQKGMAGTPSSRRLLRISQQRTVQDNTRHGKIDD